MRTRPLFPRCLFLCLQVRDDHFQELARPLGKDIDAGRIGRAGNHRSEDVLAIQRHDPAGERHRSEQSVMVDLAETGAAILVFGEQAVVLDAEAAAGQSGPFH